MPEHENIFAVMQMLCLLTWRPALDQFTEIRILDAVEKHKNGGGRGAGAGSSENSRFYAASALTLITGGTDSTKR